MIEFMNNANSDDIVVKTKLAKALVGFNNFPEMQPIKLWLQSELKRLTAQMMWAESSETFRALQGATRTLQALLDITAGARDYMDHLTRHYDNGSQVF